MSTDYSLSNNKAYRLLLSLSLAGVIPFLFAAVLLQTNGLSPSKVFEFLFSYSAIILTFLGGIQWGIGVMKVEDNSLLFPHLFTLSILPSLAGWLLLILHQPKLQLMGFILSFIIVLAVDAALYLKAIIPRWFLIIRSCITLLVISLMLVSYIAL